MPREARTDGRRVLVIKGTGPIKAPPPPPITNKPPGSKPTGKRQAASLRMRGQVLPHGPVPGKPPGGNAIKKF